MLTGQGRSFLRRGRCSLYARQYDYTFEQNMADGQAIFDPMLAIDQRPRPVIGRVMGAAIGGGAGLVSCCDIVVAVERATFAFQ